MRVTITPARNGVPDFNGLAEASAEAVGEAIRASAQMVANDARRSVARGPKTGHVYQRRGVAHQASAPGEPPATDTGRLVTSIVADVEREGSGVVGVVEARTEYAVHLEYGTRHMAARPFMNPAFERNRQRIAALVAQALATATQRFARRR
jgi:HK97 gp10 family phage protein